MTTTEQKRCHHRRDLCACGAEKLAKAQRCETCRRAWEKEHGRTPPRRGPQYEHDLCDCGRQKMATSPRCKVCSNQSRAKPKRSGPPPLSARSRAALQAGDGAAYLRARARDWGVAL
jgi:hypothetical protein